MIKIEVKLSEFDNKVLDHDILDVQGWIQLALDGKVNNVKKRLSQEAQDRLFNDSSIENIPATVSGSISLYFEQPYYQNREQRISASLEQ